MDGNTNIRSGGEQSPRGGPEVWFVALMFLLVGIGIGV